MLWRHLSSFEDPLTPSASLRTGLAAFILLNVLALNSILDDNRLTVRNVQLSRFYRLSPLVCLYEISTYLSVYLRSHVLALAADRHSSESRPIKDHSRTNTPDADKRSAAGRAIRVTVNTVVLALLLLSFRGTPWTKSIAWIYTTHSVLPGFGGPEQASRRRCPGTGGPGTGGDIEMATFVFLSHCWVSATVMSPQALGNWLVLCAVGVFFTFCAYRYQEAEDPRVRTDGTPSSIFVEWILNFVVVCLHLLWIITTFGALWAAQIPTLDSMGALGAITIFNSACVGTVIVVLSAPMARYAVFAVGYGMIIWVIALTAFTFWGFGKSKEEPALGPLWAKELEDVFLAVTAQLGLRSASV